MSTLQAGETRTPPYTCECGYTMDTASDPTGENAPGPGDLSICLNCGRVLVIGEGLALRPMTGDEKAVLPTDVLQTLARIERARAAVVRKDLRR